MPTPASAPTTESPQGEPSSSRLLEAAAALVAERGWAGTSVAALCERAGVAPPSLYWHFGSKAGLFLAALDRAGEAKSAAIRAHVAATGDPLERLDRLIQGLRAGLREDPPFEQFVLLAYLEGPNQGAEVRERLQELRTRIQRIIADGFAEALGPGFPDLEALARLVLGLQHEAALAARTDPDGGEVERVYDALRTSVLAVVANRIHERLAAGAPESGGEGGSHDDDDR